MTSSGRAAIYARISSDPSGQALGVQRQLEDCRQQAERHGITVAEEYVDNDISAYSGKTRPAYQRMLADIRGGLRDAVIVYNFDRLTRRPIELEEFSEACRAAGVDQIVTVNDSLNITNEDGLFTARLLAAVAAKESARKSERVKRKMRQNAEMGLPAGGAIRPFGFEQDRVTVREAEAQIIREMTDRFLAGESSRSMAADLESRGVSTSTGKAWRSTTVQGLLTSARIAGLRSHNGVVVAKAVWPAIITEAQHEQILHMAETKRISGRRAPRRYLLSGMLRCGKCGGKLYSSAREQQRRYVCLSGPDHRGCGGIMITAPPTEEWLTAAVLFRLDTPEMHAVLSGQRAEDERYGQLAVERDRLHARMTELSEMYAAGEISPLEWKAARNPLQHNIDTTEQQLARLTGSSALGQLVGNGAQLRDGWAELNLERQHAIVRAVLDYATVMPVRQGGPFDPNRVVPTWAL